MGVTVKAGRGGAGGGGDCRGREGVTGIRTAGSLMILDTDNNYGLGEGFSSIEDGRAA